MDSAGAMETIPYTSSFFNIKYRNQRGRNINCPPTTPQTC